MRNPARAGSEAGLPAGTESSLLGRTLGEFLVREKLGQGGAGLVFRAEQPLLAREAVIKVLHASTRPNDDMVHRFLREARLASRLDHPYAAHIYAFGAEPDGLLWIAMEFVHGTPLDKLLKAHGPLPLARFVPLFDRICEVVQTAHDQGIIHRDLKPANVMVLSRAGRLLPKLLDFGIAKVLEDVAEFDDSTAREVLGRTEGIVALDDRVVRAGLTQRGLYIGTPHYMAPEQWVNAAAVDNRTDIYALAVLSFEALTGRRPFEGTTPLELAREHASTPVPELGGELPESLHSVLSRALAKRGKDRFANVLEFAGAFRSAAGLGEEPGQLPQVDDAIRERTIAEAPQPIAEALTALEASRSLASAIESVAGAFRAIVHYLGILALASRSRIGSGSSGDSATVVDLLRKLRQQSLDEPEWIVLARELCRPFVRCREAYPIPELVSFFFERDGGRETHWAKELESYSRPETGSARLPDAQKRELLSQRVARLTQLLRAVNFIFDYPLILSREEQGESWVGIRRSHRPTHRLLGVFPENNLVLIDLEGNPVLSLWPLMQALVPTPGAPPELFMLEGHGRHGAKLVSLPLGFERQDENLWDWFSDHIAGRPDAEVSAESLEAAPYLGLAAFTPSDAKNFFGREKQAEAFANRLRIQHLLGVVGPSGSGKSSFIQAGVIPLLPSDWRAVTMRPGATPLSALAARLAHEGRPIEIAREGWRKQELLGNHLRAWARERGAPILLVVDQFEELLTLCQDADERSLFAQALAEAARASEDVRVVLTLRDDFLIRAQQLPALREALGVGLQLLGTPAPEDLIRIVTCPAQRAGYDFDDPDLPARMVKEVADQPGALALLSFTASRLWELRDRHFHRLGRRAYESLGGVGGALAQHAEATLAAMSSAEQELVREAFRHLITAERTRAVLSRKEISQVLGGGPAAERALERLIQARLLTAAEAEVGEDRIEVIHEALLSSWPRLVRWQQEDAESARMRHQVRAAARQWEDRGRGKGLLWRKEALMEYRVWRSRYSGRLTDSEEAFAAASLREETRGRRTRRLLLVGAFFMLAIGLVAVIRANRIARNRLLASYEEQGRQLLLAGDPLRGIVYLEQAFREGADSPALRFLLSRATRALDAQVASLRHADQVVDAHFSPDGTRVVTASLDKTAKLWDSNKGKPLATLVGHKEAVHSARFSPDGFRIVTSSSDGTAKIWDGVRGELLATLDAGSPIQAPTLAEFSPNGRLIVTAIGPTAKVWDANDFLLLATLEGHRQRIKAFKIDPRTSDIFTYGQDGVLSRWSDDGKLLFSVPAHQPDSYNQYLRPLALASDGETILTASGDKTAKVWQAKTGRLLLSVDSGDGFVFSTAISPDGQQFVTSNDGPVVRIWSTKTGAIRRLLHGHSAAVWFVSFSPDGTYLITSSSDGTARLWGAWGAPLLAMVGHVNTVVSAEPSPDGNRVVTASLDGTAKIWDKRQSPLLFDSAYESPTLSQHFRYAGLSQDSRHVLTVTNTGTVKLRELSAQRPVYQFEIPERCCTSVEWSQDGTQLAVAREQTAAVLELPSGKIRFIAENPTRISAMRFSPDGAQLAIASTTSCARIWDTKTGTLVRVLNSSCGETLALAFSSDGRHLLTGGDSKRLSLWDLDNGSQKLEIVDFRGSIRSAAFSPRNTSFVTASRDKRVVIWDAESGAPLVNFREADSANVNTAEFNQKGNLVLTSDVSGSAAVWDSATGRLLARYSRGTVPLVRAHFSRDGAQALSSSPGEVMIWDTASDLRTVEQVSAYVRCQVPFRLESENLIQTEIDSANCGH